MSRTIRRSRHPLSLAVWLLMLPASVGASVVTNGGFESGPAMTPAGEVAIPAGSTALPGWTVGGGGVLYVSDIYWAPYQGTRSLTLNSTAAGSVSQTFATAPGATYMVGFVMTGEPFTSPAFKHMRVSAAGQSADYAFDTAPAWHWDMAWAPHAWTFTANAATTTLTFQSLDAGFFGPALDSVEVVQLTAGVDAPAEGLRLEAVAPNPVRGDASLAFTLPRAESVRLSVCDAQGREVAALAHGEHAAGRHVARWSARGAAPGVYFVRLVAPSGTAVRRVAVIR